MTKIVARMFRRCIRIVEMVNKIAKMVVRIVIIVRITV